MNRTITIGKQSSLQQLAATLRSKEAVLGRLTGLGHTDSGTVAEFVSDSATLAPLDLAVGAPPDEAVLVCHGKVWVSGQLQAVTAYRKEATAGAAGRLGHGDTTSEYD